MDIEYKKAIYNVYCSVFKLPVPANLHKKSILLSSLMGGHDWSWKVIGISVNALESLKRQNYEQAKGLQRAHIVPRIEIARKLFNPPVSSKPLSIDEFFEQFKKFDKTVIVDSKMGENRTTQPLPDVIQFTEDNICSCLAIGYRFTTDNEGKYFRELHERFKKGELSLKNAEELRRTVCT